MYRCIVAACVAFAALACTVSALSQTRLQNGFQSAVFRGLRYRKLGLETPAPAAPQFMTQTLDHTDPTNTRTFQQKYYVNDTYYNPSQPRVLFMLGGEGPLSPAAVGSHFIVSQYGSEYGALVVSLEHRFYGVSLPSDYTPADLQFLSSKQAIYDIKGFHAQITTQYKLPSNTRWIVIGGSYSGALAAWTREFLPDLFVGALASSAPVQAQLDFPQYLEVVSQSIGPDCSDVIHKANEQLVDLMQAGQYDFINRIFNTCTPLSANSPPEDVATFFENLLDPICGIVQYNEDNNNYQPYTITDACSMITTDAKSKGALQAFADFTATFNQVEQVTCNGVSYKDMLDQIRADQSALSWTYQTCTNFGYFQSSTSTNQPFAPYVTLDWSLKQCFDLFNIKVAPDMTAKTNSYYGGRSLPTSNIVFPKGTVDPWSTLGVFHPISQQSVALLIDGTAHCADLYPASPRDQPGLTQARTTIRQLLNLWFTA